MMDATVFAESRRIAEEVYGLLQTIDPVRWRNGIEGAARERLARIRARVRALLDSPAFATADSTGRQLQDMLRNLAGLLDDFQPRADVAAELRRLRDRLAPAYAAFAHSLQAAAVDVPTLRPTNHWRSIFHVCTGLFLLFCVQHVMSVSEQLVATVIFLGVAWPAELIRRRWPWTNRYVMLPFLRVAHPHEYHGINSATWYGTAMFLLALLSRTRDNVVAIVVLAFADPFAALIGRRYGSIRLVANRSLEGTLAFAAMGWVVAFAVLNIYYPEEGTGRIAIAAAAAGVGGAVAELFSRRLDDNFTIPLAAAGASHLAFALV